MKNFVFEGEVVKGGDKADEFFGMPTANIYLAAEKIPNGVYASMAELEGKMYKGVTFIGIAELADGKPLRCETHLFDYQGPDFYGKRLTVTLKKKIRGYLPFATTEQAITQVNRDKVQALEYFNKK